MSMTAASSAIQRLSLNPIMVAGHMSNLSQDLALLAAESEASAQTRIQEVQAALCEAYGFDSKTQSKPFVFQDGLAVIPVHGSLLNRFGACYGYVTGYSYIRRLRNSALQDPDVKHIVYDINSGGGEAAGVMELSQEMFETRGQKPSTAIVDSNCYSAAFAIASGADKIIVTPSGGAGSIGVLSIHVDVSKMMDNFGVKITLLHKGDQKVAGNPFEALSPEARASIESSIGKTYDRFVQLVAQNRNLASKVVIDTQAQCYDADAALALGLIDGVASPMEAVRAILSGGETNTNDSSTGDDPMPQTAEEIKETQKAERTRIAGITGSEQAKGRAKLANHLALNTDMSVADACAMLEVAAVETAAAPAAAAPAAAAPAAAAPSQFEAAMANSDQPQVGADAGTDETTNEDDPAAQMMAAYSAQTGYDFTK